MERQVLFLDEIHRLNPVVEENFYPAMGDFSFDPVFGEGAGARDRRDVDAASLVPMDRICWAPSSPSSMAAPWT